MQRAEPAAKTAAHRLLPRRARDLGRCLVYKSRLAVATVLDVRHTRDPAFAPLPPAKLRQRVSGSTDPRTFLAVGRTVAADLDAPAASGEDAVARATKTKPDLM